VTELLLDKAAEALGTEGWITLSARHNIDLNARQKDRIDTLSRSIKRRVNIGVAFTVCMTASTFALSTLLQNDRQGYALLNLLGLTLAPLGGTWWLLNAVVLAVADSS
jgi:hypothetical protein